MRLIWALLASTALVAGVATSSNVFADQHEGKDSKEKDVALDKIPAAARTTILKEAGQDKVTKVEEKSKNGSTVFSAHVNKAGGGSYLIDVDKEGKLLKKGEGAKEKGTEAPAPPAPPAPQQ